MKYLSRRLVFAAAASISLTGGVACAQTRSDALALEMQKVWGDATRNDVEAAFALLLENHPGMVPEAGDRTFREAVERAHAAAKMRAAGVTSYEGYAATLAGFASALGDKHIWSRPNLVVARPEWAGILASKRGSSWIVTDEEEGSGTESVKGATLTSCDGRAPDDWARETLGAFRVDWSVGAQQVQAAPWLLVDEHNPFVTRPAVCQFDKGGKRVAVRLVWRPIRRELLVPRIATAAGAGAAGFGIRQVGEGYWISLQSLVDPAAPVVAEVEARADTLRKARFVVLDLRGNSGGSSIFGERIANALLGREFVESRIGPPGDDCDDVWRASAGNIAQLQFYLDSMGASRGPDFVKIITKVLDAAKDAKAAGRAFSSTLVCSKKSAVARSATVKSEFQGQMILITDNLCFSSCLAVTDDFRKLGALHVGQTTDSATHYTEVREVLMPSGLSRFSTLQAVAPTEPARYGPFVPAVAYGDDISDTRALEGWVLKLVR